MSNTLFASEPEMFPNRYRLPVEAWVLDLNARQLHIHRDPANGEYATVTLPTAEESVAFASHPQTPIIIADLLPFKA